MSNEIREATKEVFLRSRNMVSLKNGFERESVSNICGYSIY